MVTNNTTMKNDMIKTERIVRHTICCPHCGGKIIQKSEADNEFDVLLNNSKRRLDTQLYTTRSALFSSVTTPTCKDCGKKFHITIDTNELTIEVKDL